MPIPVWRRPNLGTSVGDHEDRLRYIERKPGLNPNMICDDIDGNALNYRWTNYTGLTGTSFADDAILLDQAATGTGAYYQPQNEAYAPALIAGEWSEFSFLISVDILTGYSGYANTLAVILGEAVNGANQGNALAQLTATQSPLHFLFGTTIATEPGAGTFSSNLATSAVNLVAGQVYEIQMRARVTEHFVFAQLYMDEVLKVNVSAVNPAVGSGGLHETAAKWPRFGLNSVGSGTPPTWTFDRFRYAVRSTDRRRCDAIESPVD